MEACYWSPRSTKQPMTYYALSAFKQTLSNPACKTFCRLKEALKRKYIFLEMSISKPKHFLICKHKPEQAHPQSVKHSTQAAAGATALPCILLFLI